MRLVMLIGRFPQWIARGGGHHHTINQLKPEVIKSIRYISRIAFLVAFFLSYKSLSLGTTAVVVAQLGERSLPIPEIRGSNTVMYSMSTALKRRK